MVRVGVLGAAGFTGRELYRLLSNHPSVEPIYLTSDSFSGLNVSDVFPELACEKDEYRFFPNPKSSDEIPELDIIFIAAPDKVALTLVEGLIKKKIKVIDIGGAFRIPNKEIFEEYYKMKHTAPSLLKNAVYGMSEVNRKKIQTACLIANPGCYPTSVLLPIWAMRNFFACFENFMIIDAKSGVSGAGARKEKESLSFSQVNENFYAYKIISHQHTPEIENYLNEWLPESKTNKGKGEGEGFHLRFTPHLLPLFRGIFSTMYIRVKDQLDFGLLKEKAINFSDKEFFIRYVENPDELSLKRVQYTNFLDFSFHFDRKNKVFIIFSVIDNLLKGAAGQAVQNMNLLLNLDERTGLI